MTKKKSAAEEIRTLETLSQQTAAKLAGVHPRTLRDHPLPRNRDGSYHYADVVDWVKNRNANPRFDEDDLEEILRVAQFVSDLIYAFPDRGTPAYAVVAHFVKSVDRTHGDGGLIFFLRAVIDELTEVRGYDPEVVLSLADDDAWSVAATDHLTAIQCQKCKRLRNGKDWLQVEPPEEMNVAWTLCPSCKRKKRR